MNQTRIRAKGPGTRALAGVLSGLMLSLGSVSLNAPPATAITGEILRSFDAQIPSCSVGVGIAFDGFQLIASCASTNVLSSFSPVDGSAIRQYPINGLSGIGAISFDRAGNRMWLCDASTADVYTADLYSGEKNFKFHSNGCFDGLSYDGIDGTVWASGDVDSVVTHYRTDGTVIGTISVSGKLGSCGNSGIAAGGSQLFLANNGCSEIYQMSKEGGTSTRVGTYPARLEDLECDDVNFAGTSVIWSKDAYDNRINAFDVGAVDCGVNSYRDSDADGLSDTWEVQGADIDGDGTIDIDLPALGADPLHKDLFVEVDWMRKDDNKLGPISLGGGYDRKPTASALNRLTTAFKQWPVPNPDGQQGIHLHLDGGPDTIMNAVTGEKWGTKSRANSIVETKVATEWKWSDVDVLRTANVEKARRGIFHYVVYVDKLSCDDSGCTTGVSRGAPGFDLIIAKGRIKNDTQEAVTLAHELGHNLGLGHGGIERLDDPGSKNVNKKANYISIMNYFYSNTGLRAHAGTDGIIQYSSLEHDSLTPLELDESSGLTPDPYGHLDIIYRCPNGTLRKNIDSDGAIDWNCDGEVRNGSTSTMLQDPANVAKYKANPNLVLGSEDYTHLYFWGTGETWDTRNTAMVEMDQPGTEEPTIEQAQEDGVWWPDYSVVSQGSLSVVVYPNSGTVRIPITFKNEGSFPVDLTASLSPETPGVALETGSMYLPAGATSQLMVLVVSGQLPTGETSLEVGFATENVGSLGTVALSLKVPSADYLATAQACDDAAAALASDAVSDEQLGALEAFAASCNSVNNPPLADAGPDQHVVVGAPVTLDGSGSSDPDGDVPTHSWTQIEGAPVALSDASDANPTFTAPSQAGDLLFELTVDDGKGGTAKDSVRITVAPMPKSSVLYVGSSSSGTTDGIRFADEDVLVQDLQTRSWQMFFDGSDVGLAGADMDAFERLPDGSLLMSFDTNLKIVGLGTVDDSDIVKFVPNSTGNNTSGAWSWYFDGSDVGLSGSGEDVDAFTVLADGRLLFSTRGSVRAGGVSGADEDLLAFSPSRLGPSTRGTWAIYFDGSDVGLSSSSAEDVNGVWVDDVGTIYLTTKGSFKVSGVTGDGADVFACAPSSIGRATTCSYSLFWDGSVNGFADEVLDTMGLAEDLPVG